MTSFWKAKITTVTSGTQPQRSSDQTLATNPDSTWTWTHKHRNCSQSYKSRFYLDLNPQTQKLQSKLQIQIISGLEPTNIETAVKATNPDYIWTWTHKHRNCSLRLYDLSDKGHLWLPPHYKNFKDNASFSLETSFSIALSCPCGRKYPSQ